MEFDAYVAARGPGLVRFAHLLCGDRHLAEDLVQAALAKSYRHWRRVGRSDHPDAYVRRAVVTCHLDHRRLRSSGETPTSFADDEAARGPGADPAFTVPERQAMWQALATLAPQQRAVLVLRFYEDLDDARIADLIGCGVSAVRSTASRALAALRDRLSATDLSSSHSNPTAPKGR